MTNPKDLRIITPILAGISPILIGVLGWFLVKSVHDFERRMDNQDKKLEEIISHNQSHLVWSARVVAQVEMRLKSLEYKANIKTIDKLGELNGRNIEMENSSGT